MDGFCNKTIHANGYVGVTFFTSFAIIMGPDLST